MESVQEKIDRFRDYFHTELGLVNALCRDNDYRVHAKLLYISIIDALSKSVYPDKGNRERIVTLIKYFADWQHSERVSLPHLNKLLSYTSDHDFDGVRNYVSSELDKWGALNVRPVSITRHPDDVLVSISKDPEPQHVASLWPSENGRPERIGKIDWASVQHIQLFYTYRNQLVHEFLEPGLGMESQKDEQPYYQRMIHEYISAPEERWELIYPLGFFRSLCEQVLTRLYDFFNERQVSPFANYSDGTFWLKQLNV